MPRGRGEKEAVKNAPGRRAGRGTAAGLSDGPVTGTWGGLARGWLSVGGWERCVCLSPWRMRSKTRKSPPALISEPKIQAGTTPKGSDFEQTAGSCLSG